MTPVVELPVVNVLGVQIRCATSSEAHETLCRFMHDGRSHSVYIVNAATANLCYQNPAYRDCINRGHLVLNDGTGVRWAARWQGRRLDHNHVGTDLVPNLCALGRSWGVRLFLLGGRPGVHSARYAGPNATDEDNNRKLVEELRGLPPEKRSARYVCVLALAQRNRILALISDSCEGRLLEAPRGTGGFGYDPYFFYPPLNCTLAEVSTAEKNQHSHRAKAFRKLLAYLQQPPFASRA